MYNFLKNNYLFWFFPLETDWNLPNTNRVLLKDIVSIKSEVEICVFTITKS